jgi:hypothetical protein
MGSAWGALVVYGYTPLAHGGGYWELRHKLDATVRNDTGQINSSPVTLMSPIVQLPDGIQYTINIPSTDPDNDIVNCRWAIWENGECFGNGYFFNLNKRLLLKKSKNLIFKRCL